MLSLSSRRRRCMSARSLRQVTLLTVVLLLGASLGLALSLRVWPVSCPEAEPYQLGRTGRCVWAAWAADAYVVDGDLEQARERVSALGAQAADTVCSLAVGDCATCRGGQAEAGADLAAALGLACPDGVEGAP